MSRAVKLQGATATDLKKHLPSLSEAKIISAFRLLAQDSAGIVKEKGTDRGSQQGIYAINWLSGFNSVKLTLLEQIISNRYCAHHSRVIRVLRQRGYLEEK